MISAMSLKLRKTGIADFKADLAAMESGAEVSLLGQGWIYSGVIRTGSAEDRDAGYEVYLESADNAAAA